jgi:hypothetical protein
MGQATVDLPVDLPDPLESAGEDPGNAQAQSADDLLSQLAGDEIDRLLAESGEEPAAEPTAEIAPPLDEIPPAEIPPADISPVETQSGAIPAPEHSPVQAALAPATKPAKTPLEEEMDLDAAIDAAARERMAIRETDTQPQDNSPQIELGDAVRRLPLFLRPLEWLSAPLDPWPDQLRDLIGKAGLITLVNAVAVIAYVLIFRKHHH